MSHEDDLMNMKWWEKIRLSCVVVALSLFAITLVTEMTWLLWPRVIAWCAAGVASIFEARAAKRMGRDADSRYLYAALCFIVAVIGVI